MFLEALTIFGNCKIFSFLPPIRSINQHSPEIVEANRNADQYFFTSKNFQEKSEFSFNIIDKNKETVSIEAKKLTNKEIGILTINRQKT